MQYNTEKVIKGPAEMTNVLHKNDVTYAIKGSTKELIIM